MGTFKLGVLGGVLFMILGCKDEQAEQAKAQAAAASAAAVNALVAQQESKMAERVALTATPDKFLQVSNVEVDRGLLGMGGRQLFGFTVMNRSHFAVTDIEGETKWLAANGASFGSTPFSIRGSIPAADTKVFSTKTGTLVSPGKVENPAANQTITFRHVTVMD
jgi:hypothetical protein